MQDSSEPQARPQPPQWLASVSGSMQARPALVWQHAWPSLQVSKPHPRPVWVVSTASSTLSASMSVPASSSEPPPSSQALVDTTQIKRARDIPSRAKTRRWTPPCSIVRSLACGRETCRTRPSVLSMVLRRVEDLGCAPSGSSRTVLSYEALFVRWRAWSVIAEAEDLVTRCETGSRRGGRLPSGVFDGSRTSWVERCPGVNAVRARTVDFGTAVRSERGLWVYSPRTIYARTPRTPLTTAFSTNRAPSTSANDVRADTTSRCQ